MSDRPLDRWLLVNYSGYPYTPSSLLPDNGLANLAAALLADGRTVRILDYATVSVLGAFTPPALARRLREAWQRVAQAQSSGGGPSAWARARLLLTLQHGELVRRREQRRVLRSIADELIRTVRDEHIQAVGFKLWNGDGLSGSVFLADALRRAVPELRLFGGGPHVDLFMESMLEHFGVFDAMVYGEGEETIAALARTGASTQALADVPNMLYRAADGTIARTPIQAVAELDAIPLPVYTPDVYPAMSGEEKIKIAVIDESRGCRNACAFCIHPVKSARNVRTKSIPRLMREVEALVRDHNIRCFRFAGSCTPYEVLNAFAAELLARGKTGYRYSSFAHVRESGEADFERLKASGCRALFFGVESGSAAVLQRMRKGTRPEAISDALTRAREAGIATIAGLIFPAPGDTPETESETAELITRLRPTGLTVTPPIVMPRTAWFEDAATYGISFPDRARYLKEALPWKVKFLMPPVFWKKLPFRIDGRCHREILSAAMRLVGRLESAGLLSAVTDESCLMSECAGMDVKTFRDESRLAFFAGDVEHAARLVARINAGVREPARPAPDATT